MQPNTPPAPQPSESSASPYDFIINPDQPAKKLPSGPSSAPMRILVVAFGIFGLLIIFVLFLKLLGGGGSLNKASMLSVAQDQTEIIRLATSGTQDSVSQPSKNFAINAKLSVSSQRSDLLTYLSGKHLKFKDKQLSLKQSATVDSQLSSAKSSSTYDQTYKTVMQQELTNYQKDLNSAYGDASKSAQLVLKQDFDGAQLLLTQLEGL